MPSQQIHPDDAFGEQMLINLELKKDYSLIKAGKYKATALDMLRIYNDFIDSKERRRNQPEDSSMSQHIWLQLDSCRVSFWHAVKRILKAFFSETFSREYPGGKIERLELFDEFEEWHMMQEHYCVVYAINDAMVLFQDFGFANNRHVLPPSQQPPQGSGAATEL
ncbi:hypothetical protein ACLOJK_033944 [Asimina triloba]